MKYQQFRTMYKGDLYTVTLKDGELVEARYEDTENKVYNPSLLDELECYLATGLYIF